MECAPANLKPVDTQNSKNRQYDAFFFTAKYCPWKSKESESFGIIATPEKTEFGTIQS